MQKKLYSQPFSTTYYNDRRFKTLLLSGRFFIPLERKENTKLSLLALMMQDKTIEHPSKDSMLRIKDELYGATVTARTSGFGKYQSLEVRLSVINEIYLSDKIEEKQFKLLSEVIYSPLLTESTLQEAKKSLRDKLVRQLEIPHRYAMKRAFEIAGKNETLSISTTGDIEDIEEITLEAIVQLHQKLIQESPFNFYVVGEIEEANLLHYLNKYFKSHPIKDVDEFAYHLPSLESEKVIDELPISQASLVKVYSSQVNVFDDLYYAYRIGNAALGQLPTSLLFQELREKRSLCYSIGSSTIGFDGVLFITTQLANENIDLASDLIEEFLTQLKNGQISDELINGAKIMIKNSLLSVVDSDSSILNFLVQENVLNHHLSIEEMIQKYEEVTIEDIVEAFSQVELRLNYQLKGIN